MKKRWKIAIGLTAVALVAVLICTGMLLSAFHTPSPERMARLVKKSASVLMEMAEAHAGQYARVDGFGVEAVDARGDDICYIFPWSFNQPEGGNFLYYADDGTVEYCGITFETSGYVGGLGIGGAGYIRCSEVGSGWFYIESYLPT